MKFLYKNFVQFSVIILITIAYFIVIEFVSRGFLGIATKNKNFLYYGFNKDILLEIVDLTELKFNFENINENNISKLVEKSVENNLNPKKNLWAFGASLTHGIACGKDSSSWPKELQNINNDIEVINFGFPSTYSNDSIKLLKFNLKSKEFDKPNHILWAHKMDEKLFFHRGLRYQKNTTKNSSINDSNIKFIFLRIKKTFETNSISYQLLNHVIKKIQKRYNWYDEEIKNARTNTDLDIAIENYKYNTIEAIQVAENFNIDKFIIISLVAQEELEKLESDYFISRFNQVGEELSSNSKVEFINILTKMNQEQKKNYQKFYCANKHYTLHGNIEIAKILNKQIFK
tara:strand:+ start:2435 stop:3469 length:1035 start_codon:yes stop_codon:yes gene_type:complete